TSRELGQLRIAALNADKILADVKTKLQAAQAAVAERRAAQDDLALSVILEEAGAKEAYAARGREAEAASKTAKILEVAYRQAQERADQAAQVTSDELVLVAEWYIDKIGAIEFLGGGQQPLRRAPNFPGGRRFRAVTGQTFVSLHAELKR